MKRIRYAVAVPALLVSLLLPTLRVAGGASQAGLQVSPAKVWACVDPQPDGSCGGGQQEQLGVAGVTIKTIPAPVLRLWR